MGLMFCNSEFNGDLSMWRPVSCWNYKSMFAGSAFSGDISRWPEPDLSQNSFNKEPWVDDMFKNSRVSVQNRPEWTNKWKDSWRTSR